MRFLVVLVLAWACQAADDASPSLLTSVAWSPKHGLLVASENRGVLQAADPTLPLAQFAEAGDSTAVVCVRVGAQGTVWIGTADHGLTVIGDGWTRTLSLRHGFPGNHIWSITIDPAIPGAWVGTEGGLAIVADDAMSWSALGVADGLPCPGITAVARAGNTVCIGTECGGVVIAQVHQSGTVALERSIANLADDNVLYAPLPSNGINDVICDAAGTWWIATTQGLVSTSDFTDWSIWLANDPLGKQYLSTLSGTQLKRIRSKNLTETYCTRLLDMGSDGILVGHRLAGYDQIGPIGDAQVVRSCFVGPSTIDAHFAKDAIRLPDGRFVTAWYGGGLRVFPGDAPGKPRANSAIKPWAIRFHDEGREAALIKRISGKMKLPTLPGIVAIPDDWHTHGDWIGHYGRWWASLEAIISPKCYLWGAWPDLITFDRDIAVKDPTSPDPDYLRFWVQWLYTSNPSSLELPPAYRQQLQDAGRLPAHAVRRQAECDDHGENYPNTFDGPHIVYRLDVPAGSFVLSFYDYNKDGDQGSNRLRDYMINIYAASRETTLRPASYRKLPRLACARIHDFRPGVYKRFAVAGPLSLVIEINRSHSFNTIMTGVFLDPLENLPAPWLETSSLQPDYLRQPAHRIEPKGAVPPQAPSIQRLGQAIQELQAHAPMAWACEQRMADAQQLKNAEIVGLTMPSTDQMDIYWHNALFADWDACHTVSYGETPREIWQSVKADDTNGSGRALSLLRRRR